MSEEITLHVNIKTVLDAVYAYPEGIRRVDLKALLSELSGKSVGQAIMHLRKHNLIEVETGEAPPEDIIRPVGGDVEIFAPPAEYVTAHMRDYGPVDVPAYKNGWPGVALTVEMDDKAYEGVIRAEFSPDGVNYYPIPLTGNLRFHVGSQHPAWGYQAVLYRRVTALRIDYLHKGKAKREEFNLSGTQWDLTVAPWEAD